METATRVTTTLRIDKTILDIIKDKAKAANRSLNNYIECLLKDEAEEPDQQFWNDLKNSESKIKEGAYSTMTHEESLDEFLERIKKEKGL